jgi:hypothetical protein
LVEVHPSEEGRQDSSKTWTPAKMLAVGGAVAFFIAWVAIFPLLFWTIPAFAWMLWLTGRLARRGRIGQALIVGGLLGFLVLSTSYDYYVFAYMTWE